jgi:hypothetical protein
MQTNTDNTLLTRGRLARVRALLHDVKTLLQATDHLNADASLNPKINVITHSVEAALLETQQIETILDEKLIG